MTLLKFSALLLQIGKNVITLCKVGRFPVNIDVIITCFCLRLGHGWFHDFYTVQYVITLNVHCEELYELAFGWMMVVFSKG